MRTYTKILLLIGISGCSISSFAGNPTAYLNFASFTTPKGDNYFETYLSVEGKSLQFVKNANNKYAAKAHVTISFKSGDSVVASANFNVLSPETGDTSVKPDFIDAHRFWLPKGDYTLFFTFDDPNDAAHKIISGKQPVHVGYHPGAVSISDAEFLSSYSASAQPGPYNKCGFQMVPYVFTDYPEQVNKLSFYCEIYNTIKNTRPHAKVTVQYSVESVGAYELDLAKEYVQTLTMDADTVLPLLAQVPLDNMPTGSYQLIVSVIDENNHVLSKRKFDFTKENPAVKSKRIPGGFAVYMQNRDTLVQSIRCLAPICSNYEKAYVLGDSLKWVNMAELKRFFYYFWVTRDSIDPLVAWQKYLDKVMAVDNSFDMPGLRGYRTDRGRVYLQYGPPGQRIVEKNNPSTYPYEIWEYYRLADGQTDVKFVFYSTSIETNNFELLHSTATGEVQNPSWQTVLYSRLGTPSNLDTETIQDDLGEDVNDQFNNPH